MHGNVWEWCSDWHEDYPDHAVRDPVGPKKGDFRVFRGGSWDVGAGFCRSASRYGNDPLDLGNGVGFRVALSSPEIPKKARK